MVVVFIDNYKSKTVGIEKHSIYNNQEIGIFCLEIEKNKNLEVLCLLKFMNLKK